jgi:hypothetical protein
MVARAPQTIRIGHRGAAGHAPENTLAAVLKGIELGSERRTRWRCSKECLWAVRRSRWMRVPLT